MQMNPLHVLVCGTNYGRMYLEAIRLGGRATVWRAFSEGVVRVRSKWPASTASRSTVASKN